jgi:outer membrane protein TolC
MKPISAIEPRKARLVPVIVAVFALSTLLQLASAGSAAVPEEKPTERQQAISLADAVLRALERNLDITVSRQTRDLLLPDIKFEQAKFDPTLSLSASQSRSITPLNRPFFGVTGSQLSSEPTSFDVRETTATLGLTQRILTGATYALTFSPDRTFVPSATGFLFNPG